MEALLAQLDKKKKKKNAQDVVKKQLYFPKEFFSILKPAAN